MTKKPTQKRQIAIFTKVDTQTHRLIAIAASRRGITKAQAYRIALEDYAEAHTMQSDKDDIKHEHSK